MNEYLTFTTRVELSQLHDVFRAFLAHFRDKKNRVTYGPTNVRTDGRTDGRMEGRTNG